MIAAIGTLLVTLFVVSSFIRNREEDSATKLLSLLPLVCSVLLFLLTVNFGGRIVLFDKYSLGMFGILVADLLIAFFTNNTGNDTDVLSDDYN